MRFQVAGGVPFSHPRPVQRKTSFLDGYYKNSVPVTQAMMGDTLTYDVPGHSPGTVFLVQTVNNVPGYRGNFPVPMAPYTMTPGRDQSGQYNNVVYDKDPVAGGVVIETDGIFIGQVTGAPVSSGTGSTPGLTCPPGFVPYASYTDPRGNVQPPGCQRASTPATGTATVPGGGGGTTGTTSAGGGSTSTTTTTTTTGGGGGGTPGPGPAAPGPGGDNSGMLILAAAAVAMFLVMSGKV